MNLFEITSQYKGLMLIADELPEQALEDTLLSITDELETKATNIVHVIKNMNTVALDDEIKRLQAMKKSVNNHKDRLKKYLATNMESCEIDKISWDTGSITLRKPPLVAVCPSDPLALPEKYQRVTVAANKSAIKADLQAGIEIEGCKLLPGQRGLMIK